MGGRRHGIDPLVTSLYANPTNGTQRFFPNTGGHREVPYSATECPGDWFFPSLPALRQKVATMTQTSFDRTPPAAATNLTAARGKRAITLTWSSAESVAVYEISRSTSEMGTFSSLGTTTATSYVDGGLAPKKTFWYVVRPFDQAGNGSSTAPVKGTSG